MKGITYKRKSGCGKNLVEKMGPGRQRYRDYYSYRFSCMPTNKRKESYMPPVHVAICFK
jgi:hypothetical protein